MKPEEKKNTEDIEEKEKTEEIPAETGKDPGQEETPEAKPEKTKKKKKPRNPAAEARYRNGRAVVSALILCLITLFVMLIGAVAGEFANSVSEMQKAVDAVAEGYIADTESELEIENSLMTTYRSEISVIANILAAYDIQKYGRSKRLQAVENVQRIREHSSSWNLYICDSKGNLFLASDENWLDINLISIGKFSEATFRELIDGANTQIPEEKEEDRCYQKLVNGLGYCFSRQILTSEGGHSGYYLIVIYDQETVNRGIDLCIDKTVLANALTARYELMDMVITNNGTVVYCTDDEDTEDLKLELNPGGAMAQALDSRSSGNWGSLRVTHESTGVTKEHIIAYRRGFSRKNGEQYAVCGYLNIYKTGKTLNWLFGGVMGSGFALLVLVLLYLIYGVYLYGSVGKLRRYGILSGGAAVLILFLFFVISMYFQSMEDLTEASVAAETVNQQIHDLYDKQDSEYGELADYYQNSDLAKAELIAFDIEYSGDRLNQGGKLMTYYSTSADGTPVLRKDSLGNPQRCRAGADCLADKVENLSGADIWLIAENGVSIASSNENYWNYDLKNNGLEEIAREVMYEEASSYIIYNSDENGNCAGSIILCPAVIYATTDEAGETSYLGYRTWQIAKEKYAAEYPGAKEPKQLMGVLLIENHAAPTAISASSRNYENNVKTVARAAECCYAVLSYDAETDSVEITDKIIGTETELELEELSVPQAVADVSVFNYFQDISRKNCYVRVTKDYADTVAGTVVMMLTNVHEHRQGLVGFYMLCAFLLMLLIWVRLMLNARKYYGKGKRAENRAEEFKTSDLWKEEERGFRKDFALALKNRLTGEVKDAPKGLRIPFLLVQLVLIFTAVFIVSDLFSTGENGFFANIYGAEWERCLNSYNLGAALALLAEVLIVFNFAKTLVNLFCVPLGRKVETYARLTVSVIQYVLMFVGIFYGAYLLGMELKNIGTIATVTAGVIGIGSQQLISDVGSGIAMLADGRYMIGDLVTADGFTGIIREIGIRNSVLVDEKGLEKSVSNGKMNCAVLVRRNYAAILKAEAEEKAKAGAKAKTEEEKMPAEEKTEKAETKEAKTAEAKADEGKKTDGKDRT